MKTVSKEEAERIWHGALRLDPLGGEEVALDEAQGRVLDNDVLVPIDVPPFDRALVDETGAVALDARIGVGYPEPNVGRYDHVAIHPYPSLHESKLQLGDGTDITIRPIRPEDADMEQNFIRELSDEAKYFRFMSSVQELTPEMLVRFTQIDYHYEMALIAVRGAPGEEDVIAVGRYLYDQSDDSAEVAFTVRDDWQNKGLGKTIFALCPDPYSGTTLRIDSSRRS